MSFPADGKGVPLDIVRKGEYVIPLSKGVTMSNPTQVAHPVKAALRTGIQGFLSTAAILAIALPYVQDFVTEFWPGSPAVAFIGAASLFIGSLAALVARIMAIPAVNDLLTAVGLGAEPKE